MSGEAKTVEIPEMDILSGVNVGMSAVLNGGSPTMESGTIPIQFIWNKKTVSRDSLPTHVLMIDLDENEIAKSEKGSDLVGDKGKRSLHNVSDGLAFAQFSRPGKHALIFIAFNSESKSEVANLRNFLKKNNNSSDYQKNIYLDNVVGIAKRLADDGSLLPTINDVYVVAVHSVVINVPEELFAKKPEGKIGGFLWEGAKTLLRREPRDECEFRKMVLLSPFWLSAALIVGILGICFIIILALLAFVGRCAVALCGYRPAQFSLIWEAFSVPDAKFENTLFVFRRYKHHPKSYRLWKAHDTDDYPSPHRLDKYLWVTPLELVACAVMALFLGVLVYKANKEIASAVVYWTFGVTSLFLVFSRLVKLAQKLDAWTIEIATRSVSKNIPEKPVVDMNAKYRRWLLEGSGEKPGRIDLNHPLISYKRKTLNRARIVFMAAKIKVCKPFAK